MPGAEREHGDPELHKLFEEFDGLLVSPGGAGALLGVSRKTIDTLGRRGRLRIYRSSIHEKGMKGLVDYGPRWAYIPLIDLARYAKQVGRPFPKLAYGMPVPDIDAEA
jgi:hypothetical protein